jgi:hypothetical protein
MPEEMSEDSVGPSPFYRELLGQFTTDFTALVVDRPIRRFIYGDGPILHFNSYRDDWIDGIVLYITKKVQGASYPVPISDPLRPIEERVEIPFKSSVKSFNFFAEVRSIERAKDATRFG